MANSYSSRLGTAPEEAVKAPCVVATTDNITLSGEQTLESVSVVAGDRVLVAAQTDSTENGIYDAAAGAWTRATDWNDAEDVVSGQLVFFPTSVYSASFTGSFSPGTTAVTFTDLIKASLATAATTTETQTATAAQTVFTLTTTEYIPGANNLDVYINGAHQNISAYTETSTTVVTFSEGLDAGDSVFFKINQRTVDAASVNSTNVTYTSSKTGADATNARTWMDRQVWVDDFGSGRTDVEIQAAFDAIKSTGGVINFTPRATYTISNTLNFTPTSSSVREITFAGNWALLSAPSLNNTIIKIGGGSASASSAYRCDNFVLEKIYINGAGDGAGDGSALSSQIGVEIWNAVGLVLRDMFIQNIGSTGVVIDKPPLHSDGTAYSNGIVLDNTRVRFTGGRSLVVGESVVTDDLSIIGNCMFNNGGNDLTANGAANTGGVHIETQNLQWFGGEVSGMNSENKTNGYINTVYLRSCAGVMSGVHFELNGTAMAGSYDILADNDCHGLVLEGLEFNESAGFDFADSDVTVATDTIAETAHGLSTGQSVRLTSSGTVPEGLAALTTYYVIRVDANNFKLASSESNADAGTALPIDSAAGGGTHRLSTDVANGVSVTSNEVTVMGLHFSGSRTPEILVNLNNSADCFVGQVWSQTAPAVASVNANDAAKTSVVFDNGYVTLPERNSTTGSGNVGSITLANAATTAVPNTSVTANSIITITPKTAAAATLVSGASSPYISAKAAGTSFTIATANGAAAGSGAEFYYHVFN